MQGLFRSLSIAVLGASAFAVSMPAAAQFAKPEDAIKYRQAAMHLQNVHVGRIFAMANGRVPFDPKAAADNAAILDSIDHLAFAAFVDGSDKGNTKAKPEIWSDRAKFDAAASKMQEDVTKLVAATKTGNQDQIKSAVGAVGQACKGCHDQFRKE